MAVEAADRCRPGGGPDEVEQQANRGGLARPVGAEEADDLPGLDVEAEMVEGQNVAVSLRQAVGPQEGRHTEGTILRPKPSLSVELTPGVISDHEGPT